MRRLFNIKDLLTECEDCTGKYCLRVFVKKFAAAANVIMEISECLLNVYCNDVNRKISLFLEVYYIENYKICSYVGKIPLI